MVPELLHEENGEGGRNIKVIDWIGGRKRVPTHEGSRRKASG